MARSGVCRRAFVSLDTTEDGKRPNQKGLAFMANIKSQIKRNKQAEKARRRAEERVLGLRGERAS